MCHTATLSVSIVHGCESLTNGRRGETSLCNHCCDGRQSVQVDAGASWSLSFILGQRHNAGE